MSSNFQSKFKNQIQSMGKGGIAGTMGTNSIPLNQFSNIGMPMAISKVNQVDTSSNSKGKNKIPYPKKNSINNSSNNRIKNGGEMIMQANLNTPINSNKKKAKNVQSTLANASSMPMMNYQPQMQMMNPMAMQVNPYMYMPMNNNGQIGAMPFMYQNPQIMQSGYQLPTMQQQSFMNNYGMPMMQMNSKKKEITKNNANDNNNNNNGKRIPSGRRFVEYTPYTLKDYKELTSTNIVMGPLGANIGTDEWNEKKDKMKKMENYSNKINQNHQGLSKLKKDTPKEEIEKDLKKKKEESHRFKTYEYGKLIRSYRGGVGNNNNDVNESRRSGSGKRRNKIQFKAAQGNIKDLGIINENEEMRIKNNIANSKPIMPKHKEAQNNNLNEPTNQILMNEGNQIIQGAQPMVQPHQPMMEQGNNDNMIVPNEQMMQGNNEQMMRQEEVEPVMQEGEQQLIQGLQPNIGGQEEPVINENNQLADNNQQQPNNKNLNEIEQLLQQREQYKAKINDIKDTLI